MFATSIEPYILKGLLVSVVEHDKAAISDLSHCCRVGGKGATSLVPRPPPFLFFSLHSVNANQINSKKQGRSENKANERQC